MADETRLNVSVWPSVKDREIQLIELEPQRKQHVAMVTTQLF